MEVVVAGEGVGGGGSGGGGRGAETPEVGVIDGWVTEGVLVVDVDTIAVSVLVTSDTGDDVVNCNVELELGVKLGVVTVKLDVLLDVVLVDVGDDVDVESS